MRAHEARPGCCPHALMVLAAAAPCVSCRCGHLPPAITPTFSSATTKPLPFLLYLVAAGAAKMIADNDWRDAAAVASRRAGELYGLNVLDEDIQVSCVGLIVPDSR